MTILGINFWDLSQTLMKSCGTHKRDTRKIFCERLVDTPNQKQKILKFPPPLSPLLPNITSDSKYFWHDDIIMYI